MSDPLRTWVIYRGPSGGSELPLRVFSCSCRVIAAGRREKWKQRSYYTLYWLAAGECRVRVGRKPVVVPARAALLLPPGKGYGVESFESDSVVYFIKFDGQLATAALAAFGLATERIYRVGSPPAVVFERIYEQMSRHTPSGDLETGASLYELLCILSERRQRGQAPTSRLTEEAVEILRREWADPALNVTAVADRLGVHRTSLTQRFRAEVGTTPKDYLISIRVQQAAAMLQHGSRPIADVAAACGYPDPCYFSRLIRRRTGMKPSEIRQML